MDPAPPPYPGKTNETNPTPNPGHYEQPPSYYQGAAVPYVQPSAPSTGNVIIVQLAFGPTPTETVCPFCQSHIITATRRTLNPRSFIYFAILFLLGIFFLVPWFFSLLPFCCSEPDVEHRCPNCNHSLGRYTH